MNLIAIDTSTDWCGISFFYKNECKILIEKSIPKNLLNGLDEKEIYVNPTGQFIIGGPDCIPRYIKEKANQIFSLSELTFPHEMALLILAEQLYRAVSIEKGRNYHR